MTESPDDLIDMIDRSHPDESDRRFVADSLRRLWGGGINVGAEQLARAIVFLANGDLMRFKQLRQSFMGDPRDLLIHANSRSQNRDYWFSKPYWEMGPLVDDDEGCDCD